MLRIQQLITGKMLEDKTQADIARNKEQRKAIRTTMEGMVPK